MFPVPRKAGQRGVELWIAFRLSTIEEQQGKFIAWRLGSAWEASATGAAKNWQKVRVKASRDADIK